MHSSSESRMTKIGAAGSSLSFENVYRSYYGLAFSTCRRKLWGFPHLVDEAVQVVFIILARKYAGLSDRSNLCGWIHRTCVLTCTNMMRKETRRVGVERASQELALKQPESSGSIKSPDNLKARIDDALDALPRRQREAVIQHYLHGTSYRDLARQLGASEDAVKMLTLRARKRMRQILAERGMVVSLAALTTFLESEAAAASMEHGAWSGERPSPGAQDVADQVLRELGRRGRNKAVGIATGVLLLAGAAGLVGYRTLGSYRTYSEPTEWRVAAVSGSPEAPAVGEMVCPGDTLRTGPKQEVELRSEAGGRVLLREEGELQHPTSNAPRPTSKSGEPGFRLEKGALVAELKRPVRFETAHGVVESSEDGADFWLMVADVSRRSGGSEGAKTESTNAFFTRLDVTEGTVQVFENVQEPSSPLEVVEGEAICMWDGIEPRVFASPRRELSPRYGGVFFREYADLYATRGFALTSLDFEDGAVLERLGTDALEEHAARAPGITSERKHLVVDGEPRVAVRISSSGAGPAELVIPLAAGPGSGAAVELDLFGLGGGLGITPTGVDEWHEWRHDQVPALVRPGRDRQNLGSNTRKPQRWRFEYLHVGDVVGTSVYEMRCCSSGRWSRVFWCRREQGAPFGIVVQEFGRARAISIFGVTMRELRPN